MLSTRTEKNNASSGATATTTTARSVNEANGLFQEVRDGQFAFEVKSVTKLTGGLPPGMPTPMGEWRTVLITITNIGDQPQSFFPQNQKLIDEAGRQYASDTMATVAMNSNANAIIVEMNPGFSAKLWVLFDVPPGTEIAAMELHDSAFSGGATVTL